MASSSAHEALRSQGEGAPKAAPALGIDLKYAILGAGYTQSRIAAALGISRTGVAMVVHGTARSGRVEAFIGALLGLSVDAIWPPKPLKEFPTAALDVARQPRRRRTPAQQLIDTLRNFIGWLEKHAEAVQP